MAVRFLGVFSRMYELCIKLAGHPQAVWFLCINSVIESIFWPIPPDVMLAPMCLARPHRAWFYAFAAVLSSVLGAICGYYLGYFLYDPYVKNFIVWLGQEQAVATVRGWFALQYGILMIFIGAFTPIPFKIIALTCGVMAAESVMQTGSAGMLSVFFFVPVSLLGRGLRFFLEAGVIYFGGEKMEKTIRRYIDVVGWAMVLIIVVYVAYKIIF